LNPYYPARPPPLRFFPQSPSSLTNSCRSLFSRQIEIFDSPYGLRLSPGFGIRYHDYISPKTGRERFYTPSTALFPFFSNFFGVSCSVFRISVRFYVVFSFFLPNYFLGSYGRRPVSALLLHLSPTGFKVSPRPPDADGLFSHLSPAPSTFISHLPYCLWYH